MLKVLRKKQEQLGTGLLVFFLGAWLSVLCQNCMALMDNDEGSHQATEYQHCAEAEDDLPQADISLSSDHCTGVCNCDQLQTLTSAVQSLSSDKGYKDHQFVTAVLPAEQYRLSPSSGSGAGFHHNDFPERACFLPLERYCVLLN